MTPKEIYNDIFHHEKASEEKRKEIQDLSNRIQTLENTISNLESELKEQKQNENCSSIEINKTKRLIEIKKETLRLVLDKLEKLTK